MEEDKKSKLPANFEAKRRRVEWEEQEEEKRKVKHSSGSLRSCLILTAISLLTLLGSDIARTHCAQSFETVMGLGPRGGKAISPFIFLLLCNKTFYWSSAGP